MRIDSKGAIATLNTDRTAEIANCWKI